MDAPYSGNSTYCFSNSLRMALQASGMSDVPSIGLRECLTGMPFGATFLQLKSPLFFPNPGRWDPDRGLASAIALLGWTCDGWRGDDAEAARTTLMEAVDSGPVLLGPLDMGYLSYDPNHLHKRGADHFIVVLGETATASRSMIRSCILSSGSIWTTSRGPGMRAAWAMPNTPTPCGIAFNRFAR